jgi:hypothetical protein
MEYNIPGVARVAILSPTLFNIFTSDFPELDKVQLALFAALFTTHSKADVIIDRLQSALNCVKDYYSIWRDGLS